MEFLIDYTHFSEQRILTYCEDEYSFDMDPWIYEIDFDFAINTLTLTVIDDKVTQLSGFCGLNKKMKSNFIVPKSKKGLLKVLYPEKYCNSSGCDGTNDGDWPIYVNIQSGWICIGNPEKDSNAVEFINNCIAVIDDNNKFISLWLKPEKVPKFLI